MNLNDYPDELMKEEQHALDVVISKMDMVIDDLDRTMKEFVKEAKNATISINPDQYLAKVMAQKGIKDTKENRNRFLQAKDELYHTRLLLRSNYKGKEGIEILRVGLHSCMHGSEQFVISWTMPLCRHYLLDKASVEYENIVKGKYGKEYHTNYSLLVKNAVTLRFTRVVKAINMFPGVFNDQELKYLKGKDFFSDAFLNKMIDSFNPNDYNPEAAAQIIFDEFLQELLERRSTPEFKNIVFSIQKKQGEIIQAPYKRNIIVQGCAGSGKSMIMLHRLPILLYDNPTSLSRTNLYIISPSQMYVQMAENMRHQLEISDLNMGTIEQYYDYCIGKYTGHKAGEYGKIRYTSKLGSEKEKYIYSSECINDIVDYFKSILDASKVSLEEAYIKLGLEERINTAGDTFLQKISNRLLKLNMVLKNNKDSVIKYYKGIRSVLDELNTLSDSIKNRKDRILREITKIKTNREEEIKQARNEIGKLNKEENLIAIQNRERRIEMAKSIIVELNKAEDDIDADEEYFQALDNVNTEIETILEPFNNIKNEFEKNNMKDVYVAIDNIGQLKSSFYMLAWRLSKIDDKYLTYVGALGDDIDKAHQFLISLQKINDKYLEYDYYSQIKDEQDMLSDANNNAVRKAYELIMGKIGIKPSEKGNMRALRCSPYLYLQILYQFQGTHSYSKESLLAIDESQGIAPEEIRLLKNINGKGVVFNLFGDIHQHVEGTKGVDDWNEYKNIIDFDVHEMQENYRNASQITEYCNKVFKMNMNAINTPGKGVHEMHSEMEFLNEMIKQLIDDQRAGLSAILVGDDAEARYLLDTFSLYKQKFHDMTNEDFTIHRTRWNIINIDDAKGLEFSSVIVLSGRMSRNQQYIAFTRALDDLYVYSDIINIDDYDKKNTLNDKSSGQTENSQTVNQEVIKNQAKSHAKHIASEKTGHNNSKVKEFFEKAGYEVIDNRDQGGRLWVVGEKEELRDVVNKALSEFGISGKYSSGKEIGNRNGWYTKTDK